VLLPFAGPIDGYACGWGSFSEYGVVCDAAAWDEDAYGETPECAFGQNVLPSWVDPVAGSMIITFREVLSSIKHFGITKSDSVVVFGCGPVGLTFIKMMKLMEVKTVIALDIVEEKLADAREKGADYVLRGDDPALREKVRDICPGGVGFVLDAVGVLDIINTAMGLIVDEGKICCYGISPHTRKEIDWENAPYNWQLLFKQFPSKKDEGEAHAQVVEWLENGTIVLEDYISDIFDFEDVLLAFEKLESRELTKKCIIRYR
jgi:threonine dehydrogenase-like Zn-dependent dehydrogenase